jgi:hypothetical protein
MPRFVPPRKSTDPAATGVGAAKHIRFEAIRKAVFFGANPGRD